MSEELYNKRNYDEHLRQIDDKLCGLNVIVEKIHNRLFVDNGKPSIQSQFIQQEIRICGCEKEIAKHNLDHAETSMLIKRPLISVIVASTFGALTAFITSTLTKIK